MDASLLLMIGAGAVAGEQRLQQSFAVLLIVVALYLTVRETVALT